MELKLVENANHVARIEVDGEVSRGSFPPGNDPLLNLLGQSAYELQILLDLSDTEHIDSTGVEWLLACHDRCEAAGGRVVLHSANPLTNQLLKTMRMDLVLNLADDESTAKELLDERTNHE